MMKLTLSRAATALIRALAARTEIDKNRIVLIECRSVDWQSLTFIGERHELSLRLPPPDATQALAALMDGLEDAEFDLPGNVLVDIALMNSPITEPDGSVIVGIEALTIQAES